MASDRIVDCAHCILKYLGDPRYKNTRSNVGVRDDALLAVMQKRFGRYDLLNGLKYIKEMDDEASSSL